jgi:pimeloyl-ACP methyl ester carboxylesterase
VLRHPRNGDAVERLPPSDIESWPTSPSVLIHGRLDLSSPLDVPWTLAELWDASELVVIDDAGHTGGAAMTTALMAATDRFANSRR